MAQGQEVQGGEGGEMIAWGLDGYVKRKEDPECFAVERRVEGTGEHCWRA